MNIYQKIFAWVVVSVSFGAGAFHVLATYVPMFGDSLIQEEIVEVDKVIK